MSKPRKVVSVKDLRDGLASNHTSVLHFFESLDSNKDGRVVLREAAQGLRKELERLGFKDIAPEAIPKLFAEMDKNGSGYLNYREMFKSLRPPSPPPPPPPEPDRTPLFLLLAAVAVAGASAAYYLAPQPPSPPSPPPSPLPPPSASPSPPPAPPLPPQAPVAPPFEFTPEMRTALSGMGALLLLLGVCAVLPTRPPPKPVELKQLTEPSDTYQWVSRGGLTLRVRLPRRLGKPKGEWYIEAPPEPGAPSSGATTSAATGGGGALHQAPAAGCANDEGAERAAGADPFGA